MILLVEGNQLTWNSEHGGDSAEQKNDFLNHVNDCIKLAVNKWSYQS